MLRLVFAAMVMTATATSAVAGDLQISTREKGGPKKIFDDFQVVPTTALLLRPSALKPEDITLQCSSAMLGVVATALGKLIAIDEEASLAAASAKTKVMFRGKPTRILKADDKASPLKDYPDVVKKLALRGDRECEPKKEPDLSVPHEGMRGPADSASSAIALCKVLDSVQTLAKPCEVSGWSNAVQVSADVNGLQGRILCRQIVTLSKKLDLRFGPEWTLQVFSPFSGENTIAYCDF